MIVPPVAGCVQMRPLPVGSPHIFARGVSPTVEVRNANAPALGTTATQAHSLPLGPWTCPCLIQTGSPALTGWLPFGMEITSEALTLAPLRPPPLSQYPSGLVTFFLRGGHIKVPCLHCGPQGWAGSTLVLSRMLSLGVSAFRL